MFWWHFFMLFRRLISFARSLVPTWKINDSGFWFKTSSIFPTMSLLIAPRKFNTSTFFNFDSPRLLMLFNTESPIITTSFRALSLIDFSIGVTWWLYLLLPLVIWWLLVFSFLLEPVQLVTSLQTSLLPLRKSVCIRSFSGLYFPAFGLNTEIFRVNFRIQS